MTTITMACPVNVDGTPTTYWKVMKRLSASCGGLSRAWLIENFGESYANCLGALSKNGMATSEYGFWNLTAKGHKYILDNECFVVRNTIPEKTNSKKYTLSQPIKNGRPAKFWVLLNKMFNGPIHIDQTAKDGLFYVAKGLMRVDPAPIQYSRITRCYTLSAAGQAYVKKVAETVAKATVSYTPVLTQTPVITPVATADLAPMGAPTAKAWIVVNDVVINFATIADLQEYINNK